MKEIKYITDQDPNLRKEVRLFQDPILGSSYQVVAVYYEEENIPNKIKECKHNGNILMNIGNRFYCTLCRTWTLENTNI